ncbi:MAG: hypothetical protein BroJett025_09410 [Patescibacteria group bacterium]|nr:MAG: hypothetical protein BroJett025_09410 [Patescibacteria group bacterium]
MKSKFLLVTTVAISALLLFTAFILVSNRPAQTRISVNEDIDSAVAQQTEFEFSATQSGQIALELIEANATIETQDFGDAGKFVTSINGLAGNSQNYWAFYLNGEYAEQGVSQTILEKGDTIKFVYEAISAN